MCECASLGGRLGALVVAAIFSWLGIGAGRPRTPARPAGGPEGIAPPNRTRCVDDASLQPSAATVVRRTRWRCWPLCLSQRSPLDDRLNAARSRLCRPSRNTAVACRRRRQVAARRHAVHDIRCAFFGQVRCANRERRRVPVAPRASACSQRRVRRGCSARRYRRAGADHETNAPRTVDGFGHARMGTTHVSEHAGKLGTRRGPAATVLRRGRAHDADPDGRDCLAGGRACATKLVGS
jgi:hypothetical protein